MKLASYLDSNGASRVGVIHSAGVYEVELDGQSWNGDMLSLIMACDGDYARLHVGAPRYEAIESVALEAPVRTPSKIVAAPVNYRDHQAEMNQDVHIDGLGVFLKAPTSLIADGGTVRLPYDDRRFDQEGELALVIGRRARDVTVADAVSCVFGYSCLLDITMRGGEDRSTRKSFDTFTPMGPWLVTPDEVGDLGELRLTCSVNDHLRQDADIADLIWDVPAIIAYVSSVMTLLPGDVISTGTPAGVGLLNHGDEISVSITRIGTLTAKVDATGARACPTTGVGRGPKPPDELTPVRSGPSDRS